MGFVAAVGESFGLSYVGVLTYSYLVYSPDGSTLVFLSAHAAVDSGTHNATNSLHTITWPYNENAHINTVVSTRGTQKSAACYKAV